MLENLWVRNLIEVKTHVWVDLYCDIFNVAKDIYMLKYPSLKIKIWLDTL